MTEIVIVTTPSFDRHGKRRHGRFDVRLQGSEEIICLGTQQPLLDASRVLLRRGFDPATVIYKVRSDNPTVVTMRAPIGVAAKFDVMGSAFVRRKPAAAPMPSSGIENGVSAAPRIPCRPEANAGARHKGSTQVATPPSPTSSPTSPASRPLPKGKIKMPT
jgi:hypothetical protein